MRNVDKHPASRMDRREFLIRTTTATVGVCFVPLGCESNLVEPITFGRELPFLTPVDDFFVKVGAEISIGNWQQPQIAPEDWSLTIDGLVAGTPTIEYDDLVSEADAGNAVSVLKTMRCVIDSNEVGGLIGTALWTGVPLTRFVSPADVLPAASRVRVYGDDGFSNNFRVGRLAGDDAAQLMPPLLVTHMNGQPLPAAHGGPVRLLLNETFGFKNVKWIRRMEFTDSDAPFGTYQDAGFDDDGVIRVVSRSTNPIQNAVVPAGRIRISGFAVSGFAPVTSVDIGIDGSDFAATSARTLEDVLGADPLVEQALQVTAGTDYPFRSVWTQWFYDTELAPGRHTIRVRARDAAGNVQPEVDPGIGDGINAIAAIAVDAV